MCLKVFLFVILAHLKLIDSSPNPPQIYSFGGRDSNDTFIDSVSRLDSFTGEWKTIATMPTGRNQFCGAVIGAKFYLFGGLKGNHTKSVGSKTAEVYDCSTNTFTRLRSMPQRREGCGAAVLNGSVYVAGGWDGTNNLSSVIRYDIQTDQWSTVSSMNASRVGFQLVQLGGYLFAIGGKGLNTVEKYDPATDQWSFVANTSANHQYSGATAHAGRIYVSSQYGFEVYDPSTGQWASMEPSNIHTYYGRSLVSMNGLLWAIGGAYRNGNQSKVSQSTFSYNTKTGRWTKRLDMNVGRKFHVSLTFDPSPKSRKPFSKLYIFGGMNNNHTLTSASRYDSATGEWESINSMPTPRSHFCGVVVGRKIYLFGGYKTDTLSLFFSAVKQAEVYDTSTDTYTILRPMPEARGGCGAAELNGYIYIEGGSESTEPSHFTYSSVLRYHIQTDRWSAVSHMNSPRVNSQLLQIGGLLYAIGGLTRDNKFLKTEVYNVTTDQWSILPKSKFVKHRELHVAVHNEKIYLLGDGFEASSLEANKWTKLKAPSRPLILEHHSLVSMNGRLWAAGGTHYELDKNDSHYKEFVTTSRVHSYDPATDRWTRQQDMNVPRRFHGAFVVD